MSIPQQPPRRVTFYTASPAIGDVYRKVARRSKALRSHSGIEMLGRGPAEARVEGAAPGPGRGVLLSRVDDAEDVDLGRSHPELEHLLIAEPDTHPDQIARWVQEARRGPRRRPRVLSVESLDSPQMSQLLERISLAESRGGLIHAYLAGDALVVLGPKFRELAVPLAAIPELRDRPRDVQRNFTVDPDGSFLHWPDLDLHLGWDQFLQIVEPGELARARGRSRGFNERYGVAIRRLREGAGIAQARVEGLTERQLRRIERGECRATARALAALAGAHGLAPEAYLKRLAEAAGAG